MRSGESVQSTTALTAIALETMCMMSSLRLPEKAIRPQIASAISLVVQVARMSDGTRRVTHVSELTRRARVR